MFDSKKKSDKLKVSFTISDSNSIFKLKKVLDFYRKYFDDSDLTESDLLYGFVLYLIQKVYDDISLNRLDSVFISHDKRGVLNGFSKEKD